MSKLHDVVTEILMSGLPKTETDRDRLIAMVNDDQTPPPTAEEKALAARAAAQARLDEARAALAEAEQAARAAG